MKWPLTVQPLLLQFVILFVTFIATVAVATRLDIGGPYTDESITPVIAKAIVREPDGKLAVQVTRDLNALQSETPAMWFIAEDESRQRVSFGRVPKQYAAGNAFLSELSYGHVRDRHAPYSLTAVIRREMSPAGPVTIMGQGKLNEVGFIVLLASSVAAVPVLLLMGLVSVAATPWIVKRCLAGVAEIADEARQIRAGQRGARLSEEHVPIEISPLVRAVNDALGRLDEGYERQRRFIASAAHELRTPIAILRVKVDAAQAPEARRLSPDIERMASLAEQLLELQRLDTIRPDRKVDLAPLLRKVAADLAPLLIASRKTIEVVTHQDATIHGDPSELERVFINLVQNAVNHGGTHVTLRCLGTIVEVEDDGPGIPTGERERVFEAFHRLKPRTSGSGLGLHLVQQTVERHGGQVTILDSVHGGTVARLVFPAITTEEPRFTQS